MKVESAADTIGYDSVRTHKNSARAEFRADYGPTGAVYQPIPGTLDYWLIERYCLFAALKPDHVVFGEIHHPPWALQPAEVKLDVNTMTQSIGIELPEQKPLAHFARLQEVVAWPVVPLENITSAA
jgi:uncharacterized protein YqjF (DUF2071 family)